MTEATAEALDTLDPLPDATRVLPPADVADAVLTFDLDETAAEALAAELRAHEIAPEEEEDEPELDLSIGESLYTTDSFQMFLNEAGRYPLLTAAEEVELALSKSLFQLGFLEFRTARRIQAAVDFLRSQIELCLCAAMKTAPPFQRFIQTFL